MARVITSDAAAMRLARTIASDILLYNRDKVLEGLKNDDLFERLAEELDEDGVISERTDATIRTKHNFLERAFVDIVAQRCSDDESLGLEPTTCW